MATLKLKKPAGGEPAPRKTTSRPPVRGAGTGVRKRPTLAEAEAQRAARKTEWESKSPAERADAARRRDDDEAAAPPKRPPRAAGDRRPAEGAREDRPASERSARSKPGVGGARAQARPPAKPPRPGAKTAPPRAAGRTPPSSPPRASAAGGARGAASTPTPAPAEGSLRLSKRMSELGLASRREADEWIEAGWVRVDGKVVKQLGARVLPHQQISIDPQASQQQAQRVTVLLHKPMGYVSGQAEDGYEPAVVLVTAANRWSGDRVGLKFNPTHLRHLAPAGRLDIDSTGLLVLTQDGRIAKQLIGEDSGVEKEYLVRVSWPARPELTEISPHFPAEQLERLRQGLSLDGEKLKPAKVSWQNEQQLRFVLREGKKRQIRRMCELVGLQVTGLKRVRMGRIALGDLPPGQWRYLRWDEKF
jgi:23S rRNA pseudouridine2604 synthase